MGTFKLDTAFNLKMGIFVTCMISGFAGCINGRIRWDTGNLQYSVKPPCKDSGEYVGAHWIDGDYLKLNKKRKAVETPFTEPHFEFGNGEKVKCLKTGFKGYVTGQVQWITGCLQYHVTSVDVNPTTKHPVHDWFNENELKSLKGFLELNTSDTGGPDTESPH